MPRVYKGSLYLGDLPDRWERLAAMKRRLDAVENDYSGSLVVTQRRFDEARTAGHRPYVNALAAIESGIEHTEALRALLQTAHGATPRAPWTLMRAIFEAGFWAVWILDPDDGTDRRRRGLRLEVEAARQRSTFYEAILRTDPEALAEVAARHAVHDKTYRREAQELGLVWSIARNKPSLVDELRGLRALRSADAAFAGQVQAVWRALSGLQHGYAYALQVVSDSDLDSAIPGGETRIVSINDEWFQALAGTANALLVLAIELYVRRSSRA